MQIDKEKLLEWLKEEYNLLRHDCERDMAAGVFRVQFEIESGRFDIKEDTPKLPTVMYTCMECESDTHQNEQCHVCSSKHVIPKEDTDHADRG